MDIYRVIDSTLSKVNGVVRVVGEDKRRTRELKSELEQIMSDMHMMNASIRSHYEGGSGQVALEEAWILQLQNLAYDIEDFIDLMGTKPKPVLISRVVFMAVNLDPRDEQTDKIQTFKKRVEALQKWKQQITPSTAPLNGNSDNNIGGDDNSSGEPVGMDKPMKDLRELLVHAESQTENLRVISIVGPRGLGKTTLAHQVYRDHQKDSLGREFDFRAWVPPPSGSSNSSPSARDLLKGILMQVKDDKEVADHREDATDLRPILKKYLENKRYMIVIDDIRKAEVWLHMKSAFPKGETSSVIITTTGLQSVATACSSGGYVYKLRGLNLEDSKKLFRRNVLETEEDGRYPDLQRYSDEILTNCGGLPLAIISVARFLKLQERDNLQSQCKQLACHGELGKHLAAAGNHEAFKKVQSVLVESYEGLPSDAYECDHKTCLLSMSMFPRDSDINRKSLARRWIAEGLVPNSEQNDRKALDVFDALIDGSIIEPSPAKDQQVPSLKPWMKRCRVHGVMLEFLINKSISKNFASPRTKGNFLSAHTSTCSIRRLSLDGTGSKNVSSEDLRSVRSLNMVGCKRPLDLGKCKHLRLLDLEKCTGVNLQVLKSICKLLLIKYLNLRGTDVSVLPQEMEKLCHLEMLDVRDAKMDLVIKLPPEVILLPRLAYLFGKFELPDHIKDEAAEKIGRQMHTLAGFVISNSTINGGPAMAADNGGPVSSSQRWATTIKRKVTGTFSRKDKIPLLSGGTGSTNNSNDSICITTAGPGGAAGNTSKSHGFQYILHHMKQLKKVKIWWRSRNEGEAPSEQLTDRLVSSLQERFLFSDGLESLSLHFENQSLDFLDNLKLEKGRSITLESIKLHGKLSKLPGFIMEAAALPSLQEVHLSFTGLCSKDLLVLQRLSYLKYLKIVEGSNELGDDSLDMGIDGFRSLKGLFIQARKLPQVNITQEAMKYLTTLQLICDDVQGFRASNIANFKNLDQVVLKSSLQDAKKDEWKAETKDHSNRPRLEFIS